jgi:mono/diheme cytochrome c family protein
MRGTWGALLVAATVVAQAQTPPSTARGELLYTTHCQGCHTTQVHWRAKRLATDWAALSRQVERWQKNANLGWSGEDVEAVSGYLNARYYRFAAPGKPVGAGPDAARS